MITLDEVKLWLKIDYNDEDTALNNLINSSAAMIKSATGVTSEFITNTISQELKDLYLMTQRVLINDLYNMRDSENKALTSLYTQLETTYRVVALFG